MADIFDEVSEELQRDNMSHFWNTYKYFIYGVITLIVVGVGANSGYNEYKTSVQKENSTQLDAGSRALNTNNNPQLLQTLADDGDAGYATLASLRLAQSYIAKGQYAKAAAELKALSTKGQEPYNQLAKVLYALYSDEQPAVLLPQIIPETAPDKPWRYQALMVAVELSLRAGDTDKAKGFLTTLSTDTSAPVTSGSLAKQILATLPQ